MSTIKIIRNIFDELKKLKNLGNPFLSYTKNTKSISLKSFVFP